MTAAQTVFAVGLAFVTLMVLGFAAYSYSISITPSSPASYRGRRIVRFWLAARRSMTSTYKGGSGQWAFLTHRVTGVLVFAFLLLHIVDVSLVRWPDLYDDVHRLYGNVLLRIFEVGLLFALLFHSFNGVRVAAIDLFPGALRSQHRLLVWVVALTFAAGLPGGYVIMRPFVEGRF